MEVPLWVNRTVRLAKLVFGASVAAIVSVVLKIPQLVVTAFQKLLIEPPSPSQTLHVSDLGRVVIIVLLIPALGLIAKVISVWRSRPDALGAAGELFDAVATRGSEYRVSQAVIIYEIMADYSLQHTHEFTVEAIGSELHAIAVRRGSRNVPCLDIAAIQFRPQLVEGAGNLIAVIAADEPNEKCFLLFFDPPLRPTDGTRRLRLSNVWPKCAKKLETLNSWDRNTWRVPPRCKIALDSAKVFVKYPKDGRRYETIAMGHGRVGEPVLLPDGWSAEFQNVPVGMEIAVRTRRCS